MRLRSEHRPSTPASTKTAIFRINVRQTGETVEKGLREIGVVDGW